MARVEPIKPVHMTERTKDSTYRQKSQRGGVYTGPKAYREMIKKAVEKEIEEPKKAPRTDTVTISAEARRKYEEMCRQEGIKKQDDGMER